MKPILSIFCLLCLANTAFSQTKVTDTLEVTKAVATSPADLLKGKVSGVRVSLIDGSPNGEVNVHIRGVNTLRGDSQPLWIVDGAVIGSAINQNLNPFFARGEEILDGTGGTYIQDFSGRSYTSPLGNFSWLNPYEIESIEVIKDISAAAKYGVNGANGVIVVKTKKTQQTGQSLKWNSNFGISIPSRNGEAFSPGLLHNHSLRLSGAAGSNSSYSISLFLRRNTGAIENTASTDAGLATHFETIANTVFHFGFNSFMAYGKKLSTGGVNQIGSSSTMILSKVGPGVFTDSVAGWIKDYDDESRDFRSVNSVWLDAIFLPGFKLNLSGGIDYQNLTRYIWYGGNTSFGADYKGAAGILNNSLLNYNAKAELDFARNFAVKHHLHVSAGGDLIGYDNKTNAMGACNYEMSYRRARGLNSNGSRNAIRRYARSLNQFAVIGSVDYDYDNIVGIEANIHNDFNKKYEKKPDLYWGANAYLDFAQLFDGKISPVSTLKIEGGYGKAGKFIAMPYEYLGSYIYNVPEVPAGTGNYNDGSDKLISSEYNIGLDASFVGNRYSVALKYFGKNTEDYFRIYNYGKLNSTQYVAAKNWDYLQTRSSRLENSGIELDAELHFIEASDFDWSLRIGYAYNFERKFILDEADVEEKRIVSGRDNNLIPKYHGGFGTSFRWRDLNFEANFSNAGGFKILNADKMVSCGRLAAVPEDYEKGDFLRLDNVALSYAIPMKVKWIKLFSVSLSANNLFYATKYSGWNPDTNCFGLSALSYGVDYGSFPFFRSVVLGLNVKF